MYNFHKDILLIDLEGTGLDIHKHDIIQIAAVLLDKNTLEEKKHFVTYVQPKDWSARDAESMAINKLELDDLENAPTIDVVLKQVEEAMGTDVTIANYGGIYDINFLQEAYKKCLRTYPFDYHVFNIWGTFMLYMQQENLYPSAGMRPEGFRLEDVAVALGIAIPENRHDALIDCRVEADILRGILSSGSLGENLKN
jgi:DNA polymerase III epsilon subunit-like protein